MHVSDDHLQAWLAVGAAQLVPVEVAADFEKYLEGLPWNIARTGLDWSKIASTQATLSTMTEPTLREWLLATKLGGDPLIVFWFGPAEPALVCSAEFAIANLDQAFWKAPGRRYLFGASVVEGKLKANFSHLAEYNGADLLSVVQG